MVKEYKYDVRFCKCGHIHMVPVEKVETAIEKDKCLLLVCAHCGAATVIGADKEPDWDDPSRMVYSMYASELVPGGGDVSITVEDFKKSSTHPPISEIFYSDGVSVPMMSGMNATDYSFGRFYDRWYPDFYKIQRKDVTVLKIMEFIEKYNKDRTTVNMQRFIQQTPEEYIDAISRYLIEGLDWTGTKWDHTARFRNNG